MQKILLLKKFGKRSKQFYKKVILTFLLITIGGLGLAPLSFAQKDFSLSREWLLAGKYEHILYKTYVSQIDDPRFFIASDGKKNPQSEWRATFEAFKKGEKFCQYPARLKLFQKNGYQFKADLSKCKEYQFFLKQTNVKKIWVVFASYYVNNPASAFGHTFLRFQANDKKPSDLLDFSLDYSADVPPGENAFLYGIKGIAGLYTATYKIFPYYWKVREYRDGESRDLWEYELKLTKEEIEYLMAHLWELKTVKSDYFYFSENCSYHILGLIQATVPQRKILDPLHKIVIPIDTLFALSDSGLLGKRRFRPSIYSRLEKNWSSLNSNQKKQFETLVDESERILKVKDVQVYDTFIEYYDRKYYKALLNDKSQEKAFKNKLLSRRAQLPLNKAKLSYNKADPVRGHRARRFTIGLDSDDRFIFQHKAALHQLIDPSFGYGKNFHMDMGTAQFKFKDDIEVQRLALLKIRAYKPYSLINRAISWDLDVKLQRNLIKEKLEGVLNFSGGVAKQFNDLLFYLGAHLETLSFKGFYRRGDLGYGPKLVTRYEYERFSTSLEFQNLNFKSLNGNLNKINIELGYQVGKNWLARLRYEEFDSVEVSEFILSYYF